VYLEADSYGSISGNGSWSGMVEQVISETAHVGVSTFLVTKERTEVVAYTITLGFIR
jgi:hypothetical protein